MNTTNQAIVAIDIGTTKIVAIAGMKDQNGKLIISGYGEAESKGVVRGTVANINEASDSIRKAVEQLQKNTGLQCKNVFVGISGQNVRGLEITHSMYVGNDDNPFITEQNIQELTRQMYDIANGKNNGDEVIHLIPQQYYTDGIAVPRGSKVAGCRGKQLSCDFYVVAIKQESIDSIERALKMVGLKKIKFIIGSIAAAEVVLTPDLRETGAVIIDIGGGTTDIAVYQDKVLKAVSVVPFGGNSITNDIKTGFNISTRQAEILKTKYGKAIAATRKNNNVLVLNQMGRADACKIVECDLFNVINARLDEIFGGVAYNLNKIGSQIPDKIILTGGTANLDLLSQLTRFRLGGTPIIGTPSITDIPEKLKSPQYATSMGLLLKGLEYAEEFLKQKQRKSGNGPNNQQNGQKTSNADNEKDKKESEKGTNTKKGGFRQLLNKLKDVLVNSDQTVNNDTKM